MARTWPLPALALVLALAAPAAAEDGSDPGPVHADPGSDPGITAGVEGVALPDGPLNEDAVETNLGELPQVMASMCLLGVCTSPELCSGTSGGQTFRADVTTPVVYLSVYGAYAGYSENC